MPFRFKRAHRPMYSLLCQGLHPVHHVFKPSQTHLHSSYIRCGLALQYSALFWQGLRSKWIPVVPMLKISPSQCGVFISLISASTTSETSAKQRFACPNHRPPRADPKRRLDEFWQHHAILSGLPRSHGVEQTHDHHRQPFSRKYAKAMNSSMVAVAAAPAADVGGAQNAVVFLGKGHFFVFP